MSDQIIAGYSQKHATGITILSQQMTRETMGSVIEETMDGERVKFDQISAIQLQPKQGRAAPMAVVETPQKSRWCTALMFEARDFIDRFDKLKVLNDPTNAYTSVQAAAAARRADKLIVDAAVGNAYEGDHGADIVVLPPEQIIAHGNAGFTIDKLEEAIEKLKSSNGLDYGDSIHCFWTAKQEHQLINATEVKSSDFNNDKVMVDGELKNFFKVNFRRLEDFKGDAAGRMLPVYTDGGGAIVRRCVLWARSGIKYGTWKPPEGRVEWNVERSAWQISTDMASGAIRMEDNKVVVIECKIG